MWSKILNLDIYAETFRMKIDRNRMALPTSMGVICSLMSFLIVAGYALLKTNVLITRNDMNVVGATHEVHFDSDFIFNFEQGLNIAVAFTSFDSEREVILDPSYGKIDYIAYTW